MKIIPAIELQNGRCVSLYRGRLEEPQIWHVDPVAKAQGFAEAGADMMQVTDFDWVAGGDGSAAIVEKIIDEAGLPVQVGGGFRSADAISRWLDRGASRIIVSSLAVNKADIVKHAATQHPDKIVLAVDVFQGALMTDGWKNKAAITPGDLIAAFNDVPLAAVLITDIDADIEDSDGSLGVITQLAEGANAPVIARGLSRNLDDIARLKYMPNVSAAIVSRALFNKNIALEDAIALTREKPEKTAKFL